MAEKPLIGRGLFLTNGRVANYQRVHTNQAMDTLTEYTCLSILPAFPRVGGKPDHVSSQGKEAVCAMHDIYAHALHASDAVHSLPLFQQHGTGSCLPACEGCPRRCNTTAILLVFLSDDQLTSIEHVHIGLVVHHISGQIYEHKAIPQFIQYIEADLKQTKQKHKVSSSALREQSYCMFVANIRGIMALPTDLPYCLMYPNIYSSTLHEDRHHLNIGGGPPGVGTCRCMCHALLQQTNLSVYHRQQHHGSH